MSNKFLIEKGKKIRAMRKQWGWSQEKLAQTVGISQRVVSKYERGEIKGGCAVTLRMIEEALGIEPLFLVMKMAAEPAVIGY